MHRRKGDRWFSLKNTAPRGAATRDTAAAAIGNTHDSAVHILVCKILYCDCRSAAPFAFRSEATRKDRESRRCRHGSSRPVAYFQLHNLYVLEYTLCALDKGSARTRAYSSARPGRAS